MKKTKRCKICHNRYPADEIKECGDCGREVCKECMVQCTLCSRTCCRACGLYDIELDDWFCSRTCKDAFLEYRNDKKAWRQTCSHSTSQDSK